MKLKEYSVDVWSILNLLYLQSTDQFEFYLEIVDYAFITLEV